MADETDGTASLALADLELLEVLGTGATSEVRVCVARPTGRRYALKAVAKASIIGAKQLERLRREKALGAALGSCRAVARLYRTFQDETRVYLLFELLPGGELLHHLRAARPPRLPVGAARVVAAQTVALLDCLWREHAVLYRDLKPTNLLFTATGALKCVDLAHARVLGPDERSTSVVGTAHYASPEAARAEPHGVSAQLWALGVLLFELLVGRPPFEYADCDPAELRRRILHEPPPLHALDAVGAGARARSLVGRLLHKEEAARNAAFPRAFADVRADGWFDGLDWVAVEAGELVPAGLGFGEHAERLCERLRRHGRGGDRASASDPFADFDN
jgi:serine/threonine protein kinase